MSKFARAILCMAVLTLAMGSMAFAQKAVTDSQGRSITMTTPKASIPQVHHGGFDEPELITIFNNIGSGFNCCTGWTEGGSSSSVGLIYQEMAYTPTKTHDLAKMSIAMGYVNGTNGGTLATVADKSGEPTGKVLYKCNISNMPTFGSTSTEVNSCTVPKTKKVVLTAKKQFWLFYTPNSNEWAAWNLASSGSGNGCYTTNGTSWTCTDYNPQGAFAIYGR